MQSLTELANHYGSDKGTVGPTPEWLPHNYTDVYEAYLGSMREAPVTLLEIGLGVTGENWDAKIVAGRNTGGASVKMWHDFFARGRIYGIDVNECAFLDEERVTTFVADQGNVDELAAVLEMIEEPFFDLIVDDGSHRPDHQQISLGFLWDHLKPGGLYFIEDLMANGHGDGKAGRMGCEDVLNTRGVLKEFARTGEFPQPHALIEPARWSGEIESIHFHVPRVRRAGGSNGKAIAFEPGSESLCAIRKRAA
jgi:hypothetical protein